MTGFVTYVTALEIVCGVHRAGNMNVLRPNLLASICARANHVPRHALVLGRSNTAEVLEKNVGHGDVGRILQTKRKIALPVAAREIDCVVGVADGEVVEGDVLYHAGTAAALEVGGEFGGDAGPDFYAGTVLGVVHRDVAGRRCVSGKWERGGAWLTRRRRSRRCRLRQGIGPVSRH